MCASILKEDIRFSQNQTVLSHIIKIGQTTNSKRADGKIGFSQEKALYGTPKNILSEISHRRLEDEAALLCLARTHFGSPVRGSEWFVESLYKVRELVSSAQRQMRKRKSQ